MPGEGVAVPRYDPAGIARTADPAVVAGFVRAWKASYAPHKALVALFAAGIVEAGLRNPKYGDRDSVGSLQQRRGWGTTEARMDPYKAAAAFLKDLMVRVWPKHSKESPGQLAQRVQRSAYPDRYDQAVTAAEHIIARVLGHAEDPDEVPPPDTYAVRRGDTLSEIAARHGTTVAELARLNDIRDPDRIAAGRVLRIR